MSQVKDQGYAPIAAGIMFVGVSIYYALFEEGHWSLWISASFLALLCAFLAHIVKWNKKHTQNKKETDS